MWEEGMWEHVCISPARELALLADRAAAAFEGGEGGAWGLA